MNVLVTGCTGFIGTALLERLWNEPEFTVRGAVRREVALPGGLECVRVGEVSPETDWRSALVGVDAVVHLAGRVHVMGDTAADPLAAFRHVNVGGTLNLARQAAAAGVGRIVYVSSVKVNGETGSFSEGDPVSPQDAYAISKHEAESGLREIAGRAGMELVVVRPPLVYGAGVGANFARLMRAVERGVPLPFGMVHNRRSLVALENLVDFIVTCTTHPAAAGRTFFVSDSEDLSITELIRRLGRAMGRPARLIPVPPTLLMTVATLAGRRDDARRLLGTLEVDISRARQLLGWEPPIGVDEGLRQASNGRA
jgi:nucleoside-diphosphate-sugar epimerase